MNLYESSEDYLEMMLILSKEKGFIRSVDIASRLGVTKPSVSYAVKRLKENGYISTNEKGEILLTGKGMAVAQKTFERHSLLTELLMHIGVSEETAREDACRIEHDISDETFEAIKSAF